VAGKTGTTSANKDGWFIGFSSGITTGVWMGRDDARPVPGLQGGRAPARAFAAFMRYAVRDRPVEPFETTVELPGWQLEPDEEALLGGPEDYYFIDEQGNLVDPSRREPRPSPLGPDGERIGDVPPAASRDFLEQATGGALPRPPREPRRAPPPQASRPPQEE
jgi:penicillin-binding protein 1A